ncbi:molybdenum ABC transporter ATP-binding protein [Paraglaciecola psychrophila]|uniref:Molybdate ABC transporter ATPase n=1 Tax=Paraglaciecola psychrophila 170 TaxID=1129794 RepID=K7ABR9_9ALTE|nr:molybdenum ABC transporter ATP-binding protein [Paraglaciecola psychrophila]AGH45478.1 molybdate ABC transporter ATPase [Paraglaciecola psychrophila 170]GAC38143.1 molybdate transport system ATP-binding protein [Paraglaciecola psychrophila 170]
MADKADKIEGSDAPLTSDQGVHARFQLGYAQSATNTFELDVDINIPGQGITAVFGESGSGKTSLLRCIAGLETNAFGSLQVNGELWQNTSMVVPTYKRNLGYVFQEASLFEHLTASGNLRYAIKRCNQIAKPELLNQVVSVMGIEGILSKHPLQLSGGERQRVAIARALLSQPKLLLMDEPLASLDTARKLEILPYLESLRSSFSIPILYVSHAVDEIVRLADHAVIMRHGKVVAQGAITELFSRADLPLGVGNEVGAILECKVIERDKHWHLMRVEFDGGELWLPNVENNQNTLQRVRVLASDVSLTLTPHTDSSILNVLSGQIAEIINDQDPAMSLVRLKVGASYLVARLTQRSLHKLALTLGDYIWIQIKSAAIVR